MDFQTIFVALIGGGAVGFIQYLIQRHDSKHDRLKVIEDKISMLDEKMGSRDGDYKPMPEVGAET